MALSKEPACGILSVMDIDRDIATKKIEVLIRVKRLRHRGPDWSGCHTAEKHIMAHERLSIVDLETGAQPLINFSKNIVLSVNGEIYNHKALRKELQMSGMNKSKYMTASDCEIIHHLYEAHDTNFLNKLNGIFAFVLYDKKKDRFIIARDHIGIIPLYWGRDKDGALWIASELKSLHDICVTFTDFTPGHFYDSATDSMTKWYNPAWHDETRIPNDPLDIDRLRTELENAVIRQLMSDVPYGVLLSGGLDSSIISAVAAKYCTKRIEEDSKSEAWWPRLHSFTIGLKGSPDVAAARIVADHIGTVHHEFFFTVEEGLNAYSDVIWHLETYDVTTVRAATPMYLMSRKIKAMGVKMVLSGEGADEMFGGYLYFHKCPNKEEFQKECVRKIKGLHKFDCLRANKSTAAWGVEARVPFLDTEFLKYAMENINPQDKMCGVAATKEGRIEKWMLRKAFEHLLPEEIVWRQKEQFSDGVGYSWIDSIQDKANNMISDVELKNAKYRFSHNPPVTKEAYLIRSIFANHFPGNAAAEAVPGGPSVACSTPAAIAWDESFKNYADCSGRSVNVHESAYDDKRMTSVKGAKVSITDAKSSNLDAYTGTAEKFVKSNL